jgi:hypothetical protein
MALLIQDDRLKDSFECMKVKLFVFLRSGCQSCNYVQGCFAFSTLIRSLAPA